MTLVALMAMTAGAWADKKVFFPEGSIVYDFEAAADAGENPGNKNGSAANGQAFYGWEKSDKTDNKRQDYKGYEWAEGSVLPEVCHVWRRSDRINGNVAGNGGLQCPSDKEMAIDGLVAGDRIVIVYDATNASDQNKNIIWAIGDGTSAGGPGEVRAKATINGVEAVTGQSVIPSGALIQVNKVTPAENGSGYIVFKVFKDMVIKQIVVIPAGIVFPVEPEDLEVTWDATTKQATFTMPDYDVMLTPIYAPTAQWATESDVELLPAAAEGIFAGTTDPIIVEGTVATGQGTVMYFATTEQLTAEQAAQANGWLSTLPTAADYDDATTVYVWYYIQGADTPDGQEATAENTFNDSEICATPIEVSVLSNKFDIAFNAANANTIEGQNGKGTVTVKTGDAEAVDKTADIDAEHHRLKAVKMGSTVTITTKEGYKFRKVEAKEGVDYTVDLSTLTSNFEAMDGDILFGTTDKTITIPNGAHVTLQGVNITSGAAIVCNGNATITLAAGTENTVTSTQEYNSGIRAGGNNTTLTINGTGKLTVQGAKRGAGIGSNRRGVCGNIVIEDGEIIATTGDYGAGIGSGYYATCGNITIKGGTITATGGSCGAGIGSSFDHAICGDILISGGTITAKGGNKAAGIGTGSAQQGWPSTCGNITITDGVTKVTATKGSSAALHSIGKGQNVEDKAYCGTVTIGGVEGYISESPYTYEPNQQ